MYAIKFNLEGQHSKNTILQKLRSMQKVFVSYFDDLLVVKINTLLQCLL